MNIEWDSDHTPSQGLGTALLSIALFTSTVSYVLMAQTPGKDNASAVHAQEDLMNTMAIPQP